MSTTTSQFSSRAVLSESLNNASRFERNVGRRVIFLQLTNLRAIEVGGKEERKRIARHDRIACHDRIVLHDRIVSHDRIVFHDRIARHDRVVRYDRIGKGNRKGR